MKQKLLFLTLNTFSATGGIEKVCRVAAKALHEIVGEGAGDLSVYSLYDADETDEAYLPAACFKGFARQRAKFIWRAVWEGRRSGTVLLSHVNLLPVGYLIKKASPKTRLVLMAHGIEVWEPVSGWKKKFLQSVDLFLPVSRFTAEKLQTVHGLPAQKIRVLNNCLDPFLRKEKTPALEKTLRQKYGLAGDDFVLLTVTRLKFSEQYKGYDKVVRAMASMRTSHPDLKYLVVGKWDPEEKQRLDAIINEAGLNDVVIFAGFAKDDELSAHFNLADAYIMPSTGEGFGIVFVEALFFGLPVIAGNADGSVDALGGGEFGLLVNPDDPTEIEQAITTVYQNKKAHLPNHRRVMEYFGYDTYKMNLHSLLADAEKKPAVVLAQQSVSAPGEVF